MEVKFLDLKKQYASIKEEIDQAIAGVINDSAFVGGKYVSAFEEHFAEYIGAKHCIGVGNGTDALEIALWALELPKNSEVIVPANSFIASSEAISRNALKVRFADVGDDYLMRAQNIREQITENTSAIMVVHLYGQPAEMNEIVALAKEYDLKIVEDCAQAHGAAYQEKKVGTFGDAATFSFYPGKNLGAYGDGGAIVTNSDALAEKCRMLGNHGRSSKFGHIIEGCNSRLDGIQAAVLDVKLKSLELWIERRNRAASYYLEKITNPLITLPKTGEGKKCVWHLFVIRCSAREKLGEYLKANGVQSGIHYPVALPDLPAYNAYEQQPTEHFFASATAQELLSLPMGEHLEKEELEHVVSLLNQFHL